MITHHFQATLSEEPRPLLLVYRNMRGRRSCNF